MRLHQGRDRWRHEKTDRQWVSCPEQRLSDGAGRGTCETTGRVSAGSSGVERSPRERTVGDQRLV